MTSHLLILLVAASLFFLLQVFLVWRVTNWGRIFRQDLVKFSRSNSVEDMPDWFATFFDASDNHTHIAAAREIALHQLEEDVFSKPSYLLLQKASIAAPLVGVLFTAVGFMTIQEGYEDIGKLALPLVSGVATGAFLALLNQGFLFLCELRLEDCRLAGQRLIDRTWVSKSADFDPVRQFALVAQRFNSTSELFANLVGEFPADVSGLTKRFDDIADASQKTFYELSKFSSDLRSASDNWILASRRVSEATEDGLVGCVESLKTSSKLLSDASERILESTDSISSILNNLENSSHRNNELSELMRSSVTESIESVRKSNSSQIEELKATIDAIALPLKTTANGLAQITSELGSSKQIIAELVKVSNGFGKAVDGQFNPARKSLESYIESASQLTRSLGKLSDFMDRIETATQKHFDVTDSLVKLVSLRAIPTADVLLRATGTFEDASHSIAESGHELAAVLAELRLRINNLQAEDVGRKQGKLFESKVNE